MLAPVSKAIRAASGTAAPIPGHVLLALGLVYAIWSSTYLAIRVVVHAMPPLSSGGVRYLAAGLVLLALQALRPRRLAAVPQPEGASSPVARLPNARLPNAKQWLAAVPVGVLLFAVGNGLVASAERTISSGVAAVVCGTTPLWAGILGRWFGERAGVQEWLGMGLGFAGVLVLGLGGELSGDPWAAGLLLLAPIGWAFGSLWSRRLPLAPGAAGAAAQMITGGAAMLLIGWATGEVMPDHVEPTALLALLYLAVVGSIVGFSAYHHLLAHARPSLAMSYAYVNPILAVALGAAVGGESLGAGELVAALLIGAAVVLLVRGKGGPASTRS